MEWPERESGMSSPRGFAYVLFESERRVRALLAASRREGNDWYFHVQSGSRKIRSKKVGGWAACQQLHRHLHGMLLAAETDDSLAIKSEVTIRSYKIITCNLELVRGTPLCLGVVVPGDQLIWKK